MSLPNIDAVRAIPQHPHSSTLLNSQLTSLCVAANRLGLYDAADYVRRMVEKHHNDHMPNEGAVRRIPQQRQTQAALLDQFATLCQAAHRLGLPDAAAVLQDILDDAAEKRAREGVVVFPTAP